jgi:hypothetical protein
VPGAFDRVVERCRDQTAVVSGTNSLSYGDLDGRVNAFTRFLASRG